MPKISLPSPCTHKTSDSDLKCMLHTCARTNCRGSLMAYVERFTAAVIASGDCIQSTLVACWQQLYMQAIQNQNTYCIKRMYIQKDKNGIAKRALPHRSLSFSLHQTKKHVHPANVINSIAATLAAICSFCAKTVLLVQGSILQPRVGSFRPYRN